MLRRAFQWRMNSRLNILSRNIGGVWSQERAKVKSQSLVPLDAKESAIPNQDWSSSTSCG